MKIDRRCPPAVALTTEQQDELYSLRQQEMRLVRELARILIRRGEILERMDEARARQATQPAASKLTLVWPKG